MTALLKYMFLPLSYKLLFTQPIY